ncbi:MAG: RloF protein [Candidatus Moranbacteria bacterium GW2011_GWA2_39_41]|nr:MAG: RloF protein [Candidatus Moranbacteria bacterium GW2011_GWA2_39_41]
MDKKIIAKTVSFSSIQKEISEKYIIPTLQRPYVWEAKKHVKKFLDDIFENKEDYFIGSLVFVSSNEGTVGREEIIDGQQRITTIFLMLFAVRDLIRKFSYEKKLENVLREINSFIRYNDSFDDKEVIRLKFSDKNTDDFFNKILKNKSTDDSITETQKKLKINYIYIFDELEKALINKKSVNASLIAIQEYFDKIKTLQLIGIRCEDHSIAYELFESINATAMSLANIDLIKNFILKQLKGSALIGEMEEKWKKLEDIFSDRRALLKSFIRHQWISGGVYVNHSGLYSVVEKKYKDDIQKISTYMNELLDDAIIYRALKSHNIDDLEKINKGVRNDSRQIKEVLEFLDFFKC